MKWRSLVKKGLIENVSVGEKITTISLIGGWCTLEKKKERTIRDAKGKHSVLVLFIEAITTNKDNKRMRKRKGTSNSKHVNLTKER